MDYLELIIKRFIRSKISKVKPRDIDYTIQILNAEFSKQTKYLIKDKFIVDLYHGYRLGTDVLEILNNENFYRSLPHEKFPMLFKVEPSLKILDAKIKKKSIKKNDGFSESFTMEGFEMPPKITFIAEQIPIVKKDLIKIVKRYIAFMELKYWIEKNGLISPQIDYRATKNGNSEGESNKDIQMITVENYLKDFSEREIINHQNYLKLVNLLYDFFKDGSSPKLKEAVFVKNGSKKKLAFALGEIYKELIDKPLSYDYLMLGKNNISLFSKEEISPNGFQKTNLYKYYTTKAQK